MQSTQDPLLQLVLAKEDEQFQEVKQRLSPHARYFFNPRRNITLLYDAPLLYVLHKEYLKLIELKKPFPVAHLAYNYKRNALLFLTPEGQLHLYFASSKTHIDTRKDFKRPFLLDWLYAAHETAAFFVAEPAGIHLYQLGEEEKRGVKEVKHLSGKYVCCLYEPLAELLVGFQHGDCEIAFLFHFQPQKSKNWFRSGQVEVDFSEDEAIAHRIKTSKTLGLESSRSSKEMFGVSGGDSFVEVHSLYGLAYLFFYSAGEAKLQLTPLVESSERKALTIKLPGISAPSLNIYDNMVVVHLRGEGITFIYEINAASFAALVAPYAVPHERQALSRQVYESEFVGKRAVVRGGHISKWRISLPAIYSYLKAELQVFEFLNRRTNGKIEAINWMRHNIFAFRHIDLSKMWKAIFAKITSRTYDESEIISMVEIYTNLFYTLSIEPTVSRFSLANILVECLRQAHEYEILIPAELQMLAAQLLLATGQHELLAFVSHHGLIANHPAVAHLVFQKAEEHHSDLLATLSLDIASQCAPPKEVLALILKSQRPRQAKRFIKLHFDKLEVIDALEGAKHLEREEVRGEFTSFARSFFWKKKPGQGQLYLQQAGKE